MSVLNRIRSILAEADQKLLGLIAECATSGDLSGVDVARNVVGQLRGLRESLNGPRDKAAPSVRKRAGGKRKRESHRARKSGKYPQFQVRNTTLCRIGWSKKKKEQYEHKVPRNTVTEIVDAMVSLNTSGTGPFSAEQIAQRAALKSNVSIPAYQVYAVIGWLREHEVIDQVGRSGYEIPENLIDQVDSHWNSVDTKKRK